MKVLVIIPAKLDSTRLEHKNIQLINNKTLVEHSINYAKQSKYNPVIIVSSESSIVDDIAKSAQVKFVRRPDHLLKDAEVTDVYIDICKSVDDDVYDLVVALQPDNPDREHELDYCIDYMIKNNYDDLITVNSEYKRSGSVRIFKFLYLKYGNVSKRIGSIHDSATDIHYQADLNKVKMKLYA